MSRATIQWKRRHTIGGSILATLLIVACWVLLSPDSICTVTVNPSRPYYREETASFDLTEEELREFRRLWPRLDEPTSLSCAFVRSIRFDVHYESGRTVEARLCDGHLAVLSSGSIPSNFYRDPPGLHDFLVEAIESRVGEIDWGPAWQRLPEGDTTPPLLRQSQP